jgi:hypothetical protein
MPDAGEDEAVDCVLPPRSRQSTDRCEKEILHARLVGVNAIARADVADRGSGAALERERNQQTINDAMAAMPRKWQVGY